MKAKITLILILMIFLTGCLYSDKESPVVPLSSLPSSADPDPEAELPATNYRPEFIPGNCPFVLPQGFVDGDTVSCGTLVVPEDRTNPEGRHVRIAAATFHSLDPQAESAPVVFIEGGPGVSALMPLQFSINKFVPLLQQHDVIFYDQRGVGFSEPSLACPEYFAYLDQTLEAVLTPEETAEQLTDVYTACNQRLKADEIDLSKYNAEQSAHDLEDLRTALGIASWDIYSVSYGTRVALEAMRQHPAGIRSVVLDSALPAEVDPIAEAAGNAQHALDTFFSACEADPGCSQSYPDLEASFYNLAAGLDQQPAEVPVTNLLTGKQYITTLRGTDLIGIVTQSLYSAEVIPMIPMIISDAASGDFSKLSSLRSSFLSNAAFMSNGAYYSVLCNQEVPFSDREQVMNAITEAPRLRVFFQTSPANSAAVFDLCGQWDAGVASEDQNQAVTSRIPTLILAGVFDPSTPGRWGQQIAEHLENSYFFEFNGVGHSPGLSHLCPNSMALAFLADPSRAPDASCAIGMQTTFMLPAQLADLEFKAVEVPDFNIQARVPSSWIAVKPEYFVSPDGATELVVSFNATDEVDDFLARWGAEDAIATPTYHQIAWQIYPFRLPDRQAAGYLSTSQNEDGFHFVLIVGTEKDQQALYKYVFLPVLESYTTAN